MNYNELVRLQKRGDYDGSNTLLIIDEVHNLRNPKSEKTKHITNVAYKSAKVLMLTATPFVNNFTDFVPIINMLYGGELLGVNKDFSKYWKVSEGVYNERFNNNLEKIGQYLKDRIDYFPTDYTDDNFPQIREEKKYVETILGRRRYLRDIDSRNFTLRGFAERNAINSPIQGSAADIIKLAMIKISDWMNKNGLKSKMIMQVHDELVFEVDKDAVSGASEKICKIMESVAALKVPLLVEAGFGKNWALAH